MKAGFLSAATDRLLILIQPLHALLELFRGKRVRADNFPASAFASSVAHYVNQSPAPALEDVGDLASTLSTLMLLKSRELTPWLDEEDIPEISGAIRTKDLGVLESLAEGLSIFEERLATGNEAVARIEYVSGADRLETPVSLSPILLSRAFKDQVESAEARELARVRPPLFIRVELAIQSLQESVRRLRAFTFHGLIREQRLDRRAAVVYFLAMLDLARKGTIELRQDGPFTDIRVLSSDETSLAVGTVIG